MTLGLTSAEIKEILDRDKLDELIGEFEERFEGLPQVTGALALRSLVIELIIKNNERIETQIISAGVNIS
jgi:hypothetical protein